LTLILANEIYVFTQSKNVMNFPIAVFEKNDEALHFLNYKVLIGDKRLSTGYINVEIIDSKGCLYKVLSVKKDSKIRILDSIKHVGLMVELYPVLKEREYQIELSFF
jgi:hypothetical protein